MTALTQGRVCWLGTGQDYNEAWSLQKRIADQLARHATIDTMLLLEHSPVYTAGRRAPIEHVLSELSAPLIATDRGGQLTYHGPGQLVGYPIIRLMSKGLGPRRYIRGLENSLLDVLKARGIGAYLRDGMTGVWTDQGKIAAIGVKISNGITLHGFALNIDLDLSAFESIIPCGIAAGSVTSLVSILGSTVKASDLRFEIVQSIGRRFQIDWNEIPPSSLW